MVQKKRKKSFKLAGLMLFGVFVAALLGYFVVVRPYQVRKDRQRFAEAEASLDTLYDQIVTQVGKPDQVKKENSCERAHLKSERGPLLCNVNYYFVYGITDSREANSLFSNISKVLNSAPNIILSRPQGTLDDFTFTALQNPNGRQETSQVFDFYLEPQCAISYDYAKSQSKLLIIATSKADENFVVQLGCGGPAKAEYFPLTD